MTRRLALLSLAGGWAAYAAEPVTLESAQLQNAAGETETVRFGGTPAVIVFISTQCPISNDYNDRMNALYREYDRRGVRWVFVNANQNESLKEVVEHTRAAEFTFPVYKDVNNVLADKLGAVVTPEAFLFDGTGTLRYHGHIDDSRNPARVQVSGLRNALDEVLAGKAVTRAETKSFGCTIKKVRKTS